jgi:hypothetical protein
MTGMMYSPSKSGVPDVILQYRADEGVDATNNTHSIWTVFPTNYILLDPKSLVVLGASKFTFAKDGFLEVFLTTYGNTTVKFRVNDHNTPVLNCGLGAGGYAFGPVPGGIELKMQVFPEYNSSGVVVGAAVDNGPEVYTTLKYWAK